MRVPDAHDLVALSVVIPAYNESGRLLPHLSQLIQYLDRRHLSYEVIVVDDGSRDNTFSCVTSFQETAPHVRVMRFAQNRGKGAAVRAGIKEARGRLCLFTDADGATSIQELERLETAIADGADLAIGSRTLASRDRRYTVHARWHRTALGSVFNGIVGHGGIAGIADTQCGFKLFRHSVARDLFTVSHIDGFGFDLELLYVAQRRGYRIAEVPVNWTDQPGSKVRLFRDGLRMVHELLTIRRNDVQGLYGVGVSLHPAEDSLFHSVGSSSR